MTPVINAPDHLAAFACAERIHSARTCGVAYDCLFGLLGSLPAVVGAKLKWRTPSGSFGTNVFEAWSAQQRPPSSPAGQSALLGTTTSSKRTCASARDTMTSQRPSGSSQLLAPSANR